MKRYLHKVYTAECTIQNDRPQPKSHPGLPVNRGCSSHHFISIVFNVDYSTQNVMEYGTLCFHFFLVHHLMCPQRQTFRGLGSGELSGQCYGPLGPSHRPGKRWSWYVFTAQLKYEGALLCWNRICNRVWKGIFSNRSERLFYMSCRRHL
jgi:hypothetical protein